MKLNVFKIPKDKVSDLKEKFRTPSFGLKILNTKEVSGYKAIFYFSEDIETIEISWVNTYSDFFQTKPHNKVYFGCYLWENDDFCFALSYGKCHFYLRQFCDQNFGTELAKRIADKKDIRQKSSKKFAGKKKKEIKSYTKNTQLDIESGESVDYVQSSILEEYHLDFGKSGKFGSSALLNPDIEKDKLIDFFNELISVMKLDEKFSLPRTMIIDNTIQAKEYESTMIDEILSISPGAEFASNSHELFGVDFVFSGYEKYKLSYSGHESDLFDELTIDILNKFVSDNSVPKKDILSIKVTIEKEDLRSYSKSVKDSLEYIVEDNNVMLSNGKWTQFNEDYINQLNEYIDEIDREDVEEELLEITKQTEDKFNKEAVNYGYSNADKDFSKIKVATGVAVEAWDLKKDNTVYAVKMGTPQKIGYVCDQSINTLELINKKANISKLDTSFKRYCLWLVLKNKEPINKISDIKSIILKQKIESWARKCWEFGITPVLKVSYINSTDSE